MTNAAAAAASVLRITALLQHASLLVACVDEADGRTLAAALAAHLSGARLLNVCDWPLSTSDELSRLEPRAATGDALVSEALGAAAQCPK